MTATPLAGGVHLPAIAPSRCGEGAPARTAPPRAQEMTARGAGAPSPRLARTPMMAEADARWTRSLRCPDRLPGTERANGVLRRRRRRIENRTAAAGAYAERRVVLSLQTHLIRVARGRRRRQRRAHQKGHRRPGAKLEH